MYNTITGSQTVNKTQNILRLPEVLKRRGRSRSSHYLDIQQGLFVKPILIGLRSIGTPENEVNALNAARIAGLSNDEIRVLVVKLEAARKADFMQGGYHDR